ncbi:TerB family tellurite resistance protein [uncultured Maribacter sp.]|uniref:TerB family tellurite resistance protein n=1 Tax=uncultured Maribacter sp. TaxID=431308 RepID=UPI002622AB07|nr:TerB family tellurite resistance protein [uncultured Maribacter sp.]
MSISQIYESGTQKRNVLHFAAIVNMALVDGKVNKAEQEMLNNFSRKLDISEEQHKEIMNNISSYPLPMVTSIKERFEYIYELFCMIYADHEIDELEMHLIKRYAIGIGFDDVMAKKLIQTSIKIFSGKVSFDEYTLFVKLLSE